MIKYFNYLLKKNINLIILEMFFSIIFFDITVNKTFNYFNDYFLGFLFTIIVFLVIIFLSFSILSNILINDLFSNEKYFIYSLPINSIYIVFSKVLLCFLYIFINSLLFSTLGFFKYGNTIDFIELIRTIPHIFFYLSITYFFIIIYRILLNSKNALYILVSISIILFSYFYSNLLLYSLYINSFIIFIFSIFTIYISAKLIDKKLDI